MSRSGPHRVDIDTRERPPLSTPVRCRGLAAAAARGVEGGCRRQRAAVASGRIARFSLWAPPLFVASHCNQWGRWFEQHCLPVLLLTVTIDISTNKCCFAPFCNDSDPRCANLHSASQGAPSSPLKLGVLPQYHPEPMPAISALRFSPSRKPDLKTFLRGNL